jgi:Putative transmembrane protein (PGPGW).
MVRATLITTYKLARRLVIGVLGATVVLIGVAMLVLPGPALVVIPLGLAILGLEFAWARHWLYVVKQRAQDMLNNRNNRRSNNSHN